jgi:hypothetical protein
LKMVVVMKVGENYHKFRYVAPVPLGRHALALSQCANLSPYVNLVEPTDILPR